VITGFSIVVIRCGGVADIGGVSRVHMIFNTPILLKKNHVPWKSGCVSNR
jgi:hypothetical protein